MADGIVQVPPDSTGKKIDAASMDVGANTVMRQRIVIGDNSATAQFATVTSGALMVTGTVSLGAGTALIGGVSLVAGTSNIGFINNISATVVVAGEIANGASLSTINKPVLMGGNTSAGGAGGLMVTLLLDTSGRPILGAGTNNIGAVSNAAGTALMGAVSLAAGTANIGFINNISATVTVAGVVGLTAGTAVIGDLNAISRTVQVAIGTPFTVNNISATVTVVTANPYIVSIPSASHGPKTVTVSVSSAATVLIANPGDGVSLYITQIMCTNGGTVNSRARIGTSATPDTVVGFMASAGGGFVVNFDPPWKLSASATAIASVKPNTVGDCYFLVNFYVAA